MSPNRSRLLLIPGVTLTLLAGCPWIVNDDHEQLEIDCVTSDRCDDLPRCRHRGHCDSDQLCHRGHCVTPKVVSCAEHRQCGDAACCRRGRCQRTALCSGDEQCGNFGDSYVCDSRGSCAPQADDDLLPPQDPDDEPPVPAAALCERSSDCDSGHCLNGVCATCEGEICTSGRTCQFDRQCPTGRVCLDTRCRQPCEDASQCAAGQNCADGFCDAAPVATCEAGQSCPPGEACLNSVCGRECTASGECAAGSACQGPFGVAGVSWRVCIAADSRVEECLSDEHCAGGRQCIDRLCRQPCFNDLQCADCEDGHLCSPAGICVSGAELIPECKTTDECIADQGQVCLNGRCQLLQR